MIKQFYVTSNELLGIYAYSTIDNDTINSIDEIFVEFLNGNVLFLRWFLSEEKVNLTYWSPFGKIYEWRAIGYNFVVTHDNINQLGILW
jgi:hypothetical protein